MCSRICTCRKGDRHRKYLHETPFPDESFQDSLSVAFARQCYLQRDFQVVKRIFPLWACGACRSCLSHGSGQKGGHRGNSGKGTAVTASLCHRLHPWLTARKAEASPGNCLARASSFLPCALFGTSQAADTRGVWRRCWLRTQRLWLKRWGPRGPLGVQPEPCSQ